MQIHELVLTASMRDVQMCIYLLLVVNVSAKKRLVLRPAVVIFDDPVAR